MPRPAIPCSTGALFSRCEQAHMTHPNRYDRPSVPPRVGPLHSVPQNASRFEPTPAQSHDARMSRGTPAMTLTADSARAVFDRLTRTNLPAHTPVLFDTGCVLGGSIAGLLAARVLAKHARTVPTGRRGWPGALVQGPIVGARVSTRCGDVCLVRPNRCECVGCCIRSGEQRD